MRSSSIARSLALIMAFSLSLIMMVFLFSAPVMAQATTGKLSPKASEIKPLAVKPLVKAKPAVSNTSEPNNALR